MNGGCHDCVDRHSTRESAGVKHAWGFRVPGADTLRPRVSAVLTCTSAQTGWNRRALGRRPCRRREPEICQYPGNSGRLIDQRNQPQTAATARARQHVDPKRAAHQPRPAIIPATGQPTRDVSGCSAVIALAGPDDRLPRPGHDRLPSPRTRRQDAVIQEQVHPRPRDQHGQSRERRPRREHERRGSVAVVMAQRQPHALLRRQGPADPTPAEA